MPPAALLLAYAIVSKLFPGVLLFYLLLRRDWRAVGWTAAWASRWRPSRWPTSARRRSPPSSTICRDC